MSRPTAIALAFSAALAAGCSASSATHASGTTPAATAATTGPGGTQLVTIHGTNGFRFSPASVTAHVGKLQVTLVDDGSYPHNLEVAALHETSRTVTGDPGGSTTTFTLVFTHAGTYNFVCTYHSSAGMQGQFVIH